MCRAKGFSLLEVLVGAVLLLLLLGLSLQILLPMAKGSQRGAQQVELQQTAQIAMDGLLRELARTPAAGVATGATTDGFTLALQPMSSVAADGTQIWSNILAVYRWTRTDGRLTRLDWPPAPPLLARVPSAGTAFQPTAAELEQLAAAPGRALAAHVSRFEAELLPDGTVTVHLGLEAPSLDGRPAERFDLERRAYLRNKPF